MELDRSTYIGSSDIAGILGVSPWQTPLSVYHAKIDGEQEPDADKQKIFARGKRLEPYVLDMLREEEGLHIVGTNQRYTHPDYSFLAGEIDAEYFDKKLQSTQNIEIKTANFYSRGEWGDVQTDAIPVYYTAQAMHNLMTTRRKVCVFGALLGVDDFRVYRVERDNALIDFICNAEVNFWREHIQKQVPPEPKNIDDVLRFFGVSYGKAVEANEKTLIAYNELKRIKEEIKGLETKEEEVKTQIILQMKDADILLVDGKPLATFKEQSAKRFDQKSFEHDNTELFELYKKTTTTRVFRLK